MKLCNYGENKQHLKDQNMKKIQLLRKKKVQEKQLIPAEKEEEKNNQKQLKSVQKQKNNYKNLYDSILLLK